jgi:hypothetical protein
MERDLTGVSVHNGCESVAAAIMVGLEVEAQLQRRSLSRLSASAHYTI